MKVTQEIVNGLNALIKINITEDDYKNNFEKQIKEYQKKVNIKGFRTGQVPIFMIKKLYGTPIKVEEINKIVTNELFNYLKDNNIEIFANPIPQKNDDENFDWENQTNFEFIYEIGLKPKINIDLSNFKTDYYNIIIDDDFINKKLSEIQYRFGEDIPMEIVGENDTIHVNFVEIDENANPIDNGIQRKEYFDINNIQDIDIKNKFIGLKLNDTVKFKISDITNKDILSSVFHFSKQEIETINNTISITIEKILNRKPANLDNDLYEKIFPKQNINNLDDFKAKLKELFENDYKYYSNEKFSRDVIQNIINNTDIELPNEFIKKMLLNSNKNIKTEQIDNEYNTYYLKLFKEHVVENQILKDNSINIEEEEVDNYIRSKIEQEFKMYGSNLNLTDEYMTHFINKFKKDENEMEKIYEEIKRQKLNDLLINLVDKNEKNVTVDEFIKL